MFFHTPCSPPYRGEYGDDDDDPVAVAVVGVVAVAAATVEAVVDIDESIDKDVVVLTAKFSSFENPAAERSPRGNGLAPGPMPSKTSSSEG